jgi:hypothetical protein
MKAAAAGMLALLILPPAFAQEFKPAGLIEKERYVFGLPVGARKGSRFAKLNLVPSGWELWVVAVNGTKVEQFGDTDMAKPVIVEKARACTEIHEALSNDKGSGQMVLTIVVRRPGNSRGILVEVSFPGWDAGLEYPWRKWRQNPQMIILPTASSAVGAEPYTARVTYTEAERLEEVAEYELRKREEAEDKKTPLKLRESFRIAQRRLRLDAGIQKPDRADDAYLETRRSKSQDLLKRAEERLGKKDWFEAHRLARAATALDISGDRGKGVVDRVKAGLAPLDADDRARLRAKVLTQAMAEVKERNLVEAGEGATFCLLLTEGDKEAAKILNQTRRAAFGGTEIAKTNLDRWIGVLGELPEIGSGTGLKEDVVYRVTGKVARAGPFTLVDSGKDGSMKWVFEDKAGLKFAEGETFTLVAVFEGAKPPTALAEDLKMHPVLRVIVVR